MKPIIYCLVILLAIPTLVTASVPECEPGFLGYFEGNDDVAAVNAALGIDASLLSKVEDPPGFNGPFVLNVTEWDEGDPIAGDWIWGQQPANLLTMKANGGWAAYCLLPPCDEPLGGDFVVSGPQMGFWDTRDHLGGKGLSHASLWSVECINAPEPSTLMLLGIGLVGVALWRKR